MNTTAMQIAQARHQLENNCMACYPKAYTIIFGFLWGAIISSGIIGNIFIIFVIVMDKKLMSSSINQFLLNLAIADLGNLIFCTPDVIMILIDRAWILPDGICSCVRFLQEYSLYASVLLQMAIGVERFLAICSPMRMQRFSSRTTMLVLGGVWCTAGCFASPYFLFQGVRQARVYKYCTWTIDHPFKDYFKNFEIAVLYAFPLALLTTLYGIMCRVLWGNGGDQNIANQNQQLAILKLRRSVVKMLIISMLLYFLCYTPIQILHLLKYAAPVWLRLSLNGLSFTSSASNPIVYIICCRHFRLRLKDLLNTVSNFCFWIFPTFGETEYESVDEAMTTKLSRSPYVSFRSSRRQTSRQTSRHNLSTLL